MCSHATNYCKLVSYSQYDRNGLFSFLFNIIIILLVTVAMFTIHITIVLRCQSFLHLQPNHATTQLILLNACRLIDTYSICTRYMDHWLYIGEWSCMCADYWTPLLSSSAHTQNGTWGLAARFGTPCDLGEGLCMCHTAVVSHTPQ